MAKSPPWGLHWRSSTLFIVSTVGIGLFTDLFLYGLVVPILPFILQDRVSLPQDQIQSHVSALLAAYAAASVVCSPIAGIIADRLSARQTPFLAGLLALLAATLILFLGQTVAVLAVARVLQGVSAAVVWTVGLALVLDTVGPENLGKTIGSVSHIALRFGSMRLQNAMADLRLHFHRRACSSGSGRRRLQKGWLWRRFRHGLCHLGYRLHHASFVD